MRYILSVGTNLGDRKGNIERAVDALNNIPYTDVVSVSSIYETEPVGYARQDDFYNAVLVVTSQFEPHEMLGICLGIESGVGRVRGIKNGPRILDLDIILPKIKRLKRQICRCRIRVVLKGDLFYSRCSRFSPTAMLSALNLSRI